MELMERRGWRVSGVAVEGLSIHLVSGCRVLRLAQIQRFVSLEAVAMIISAPVQRGVVVVGCVSTQLVVVHR